MFRITMHDVLKERHYSGRTLVMWNINISNDDTERRWQ